MDGSSEDLHVGCTAGKHVPEDLADVFVAPRDALLFLGHPEHRAPREGHHLHQLGGAEGDLADGVVPQDGLENGRVVAPEGILGDSLEDSGGGTGLRRLVRCPDSILVEAGDAAVTNEDNAIAVRLDRPLDRDLR